MDREIRQDCARQGVAIHSAQTTGYTREEALRLQNHGRRHHVSEVSL